MKPKFMIKYGKEEHLQQLVDGKIRFAPSQTYVQMCIRDRGTPVANSRVRYPDIHHGTQNQSDIAE